MGLSTIVVIVVSSIFERIITPWLASVGYLSYIFLSNFEFLLPFLTQRKFCLQNYPVENAFTNLERHWFMLKFTVYKENAYEME